MKELKSRFSWGLLLSFVLLMGVGSVWAKDKPLDKKKWEEVRSGYDYTEKLQKKEKPKPRKSNDWNPKVPKAPSVDFSPLSYVVIGALVVGVLFMLVKMLSGASWNKSVNTDKGAGTIYDEQMEEKIHELDLEGLLKQALDLKEYKEAIRILFLIEVKRLSDAKLIVWKKDKTNYEYARELRFPQARTAFRNIIHIYERVWFGKETIDAEVFEMVSPAFYGFKNELKARERK